MPEPSRSVWTVLVMVGWLGAAAVATILTIGAVSLIGVGLLGGSTAPLSEDEVASALADASPAPPATESPGGTAAPSPGLAPTQPSATATMTPPATTAPTTPASPPASPSAAVAFSRSGNTIVARCAAGVAQIVSWTPALGYHASGGVDQHGDEAEVEFESPNSKVRFRVACAGDQPTAEIDED